MKRSGTAILLRTPVGRLFLAFGIAVTALIVARITFDLQTAFVGSRIVCRSMHYDYLIRIPPGVHDTEYRYPLLIYLHGTGECDLSVRGLAGADVVHYAGSVARSPDFPFLVVSPKTDRTVWEPERLIDLVDELLRDENLRWKIDPERIYLTGFSMGGFGTLSVAAEYPDRFAAFVPVAGGTFAKEMERFPPKPIWSFHGELDDVVPCRYSIEIMESLRLRFPESRDRFRLTVYPDADHGIPRRVYRNTELYRWLLRHRN